jgi:hypothetical protein
MLRKVVTGGQTGAEQAAWASARRAGIETGGYMPRGFLTDAGPAPRVGALYGAVEFPMDDARRIRANLRRADGLFWLGDAGSADARDAFAACVEQSTAYRAINLGVTQPSEMSSWLGVFETSVLVVGGEGESRCPGIGLLVEAFLDRVFAGGRAPSRRFG